MEDISINSKIFKRIDIYVNKEEIPPLKEERTKFIQNKMMKFYKLIRNKDDKYTQYLFMSDNKGEVYMYEFNKENTFTKISNFGCICNDSKYILVDLIKSAKYDYYISLNLNPCLNIFKLKKGTQNENKEIEILQHINLEDKSNKYKYYKVFELNSKNKDYLVLFSEDRIELWSNNNKDKDNVKYEKEYKLLYNNNQNIENGENNSSSKISNVYKINDEKIVLFDNDKLEFIYIKISEIKNNSAIIKIGENIKIKGIKEEDQSEKVNSLFVDKDYIFLGLSSSLILVSVPYGEIIQKYDFGGVKLMKKINDEKDTMIYAETKENEYCFIKFKFLENTGLKEERRIKYDKWIYRFDVIQNGEIMAIYDIKGFITLFKIN